MNKIKLFICFLFFSYFSIAQQKVAYVVTESIMKELTESQEAQRQLDALSRDWQSELKKMETDLEQKFEEYDSKKLFMSDRKRAEEEKELQDLDVKITEYRNKKFGNEGEMFQKQSELMKPIQEKILKAIKEVALSLEYDYVFDKSSSTLLMYSNEKHDITQKVIEKLQK